MRKESPWLIVGARCGEPCSCQETLILRTCRSHAVFKHSKYHAVWKGPGEKTCWQIKEKVAWQRKRWLPSSWLENRRRRSTGKRSSAAEKCCPLAAGAHRLIGVVEALSQVKVDLVKMVWRRTGNQWMQNSEEGGICMKLDWCVKTRASGLWTRWAKSEADVSDMETWKVGNFLCFLEFDDWHETLSEIRLCFRCWI